MTTIRHLSVLRKRDAGQHMARFHALLLQGALPLEDERVDLCHEWGRIGCPGRVAVEGFPSEAAARKAAGRLELVKRRKGYR
jgi:predicted DNA-binding WGR domain protein